VQGETKACSAKLKSVGPVDFIRRLLEKGQATPLGKIFIFLAPLFSLEWDRQPALKFNMNPDVPFIFRLMLHAPSFLGYVANFSTAPIGRFLRLLLAFTDPSNIQMHVSWCHSIAEHSIVLPIKFEDGLSISVLRKKVILSKIMHLNFLNPAEKSTVGR
jgi:hypothetical protein